MMIYGEIDHRLDSVVKFDSFTKKKNPYLRVVHPNNTVRWIADELSERLSDPYCRGILLVKGVPRAGISDDEFQRLKGLYGSRFHISAQAVGTAQEDIRLKGALAARFARFFQHVRSKDVLDWNILDPPWPEAVVAVYLLAKVMSLDDRACKVVENRQTEWELIWEEAKREYKTVTGYTMTHSGLDRNTAEDLTVQIGQQVQKIIAQMPCDAAQKRGILRHSWLKNQILPINEDYVVRMHKSLSLVEARQSFERMIEPEGKFSDYLDVAHQLVRGMVKGFSPAQLINSGPLVNLPKDVLKVMKTVIHAEYLNQSEIEKQRYPITKAIKDLRKTLKEFSTLWFQQPSADDYLIRKAFIEVQVNAGILQDRLGTLPEGFVLP